MRSQIYHTFNPRFECRRPYTFLAFMGDAFMTLVTGGFWLIWVFCREMRNPR